MSEPVSSLPPPGPLPAPRSHRVIVTVLAALALVAAWCTMADISRTDPWYRNTDMNIHNMVDALAMNSSLAPNPFAQPAFPLKYLLALDYRTRHYAGLLPTWNMKKFAASADPLREIPPLIHVERVHSRILVMLLILAGAALVHAVARDRNATCLAIILLCGSAGLLFHGLLTRPELLCVGFGNILALLCTWRATASPRWRRKHAWLFLAGVFCGLAFLEKLPGVCYVVFCYAWCWLSAWTGSDADARPADSGASAGFWSGLLPAAAGASVLWLVGQLGEFHDALGPVVLARLRLAAAGIALLPLLTLLRPRHRVGLFLLERGRELALLGGGALATLPLGYLLLRAIMTESSASSYLTGVLHFVIDPAPFMKSFLADTQDTSGVMTSYFRDNAFLIVSTPLLLLAVWRGRAFSPRLRAFITLLPCMALGVTLLMSRRHFSAQYSIFPQVPLLLAWALSLPALAARWHGPRAPGRVPWPNPLVFAAATVITLGVVFSLRPKYDSFQADAELPVNYLTLTFLFDHDAHVPPYLQAMKAHYVDRQQFARTLEQYLADPANRY